VNQGKGWENLGGGGGGGDKLWDGNGKIILGGENLNRYWNMASIIISHYPIFNKKQNR